MKLRTILAAFAVMASGSLYAQNATKADLDKLTTQVNALSQKLSESESKIAELENKAIQLEADVERIVTENVNLVEQLNIKTITSVKDNAGLQWDIVRVEPANNDVAITLRITNNSGFSRSPFKITSYDFFDGCHATDSNTNLSNNRYGIEIKINNVVNMGAPINTVITIKNVPTTCTYLSEIAFTYNETTTSKRNTIRFTGVHIPW